MHITNYSGLSVNLYVYFLFIYKVADFAKKKHFSKNSLKFSINFFLQKPAIGHTYICTKCIDNFKFTISLKS